MEEIKLIVRERHTRKNGFINNITIPKALVVLLQLQKGDVLVLSDLDLNNKSFKVTKK
jgi:hypothetical protein